MGELEVGRISAKQLTTGRVVTKSPIHLPPPPPPPPFITHEFLTSLSPIPPITDEGLTLEMSAFKLFTMANLHYQLS